VTSVDKGANAINTRGIPRRYGIWKTALSLLSKIKTFFMVFLLGSPMATLKLGFAVLFLHVGLVCGMDNDVSPTPGGNSFLTSVQKWAPVERKRTNDALEFTFYVSCFSSWVLWKGT
jgi:hypothetical protein